MFVKLARLLTGPLWKDTFESDNILFTGASPILEVDSRQENKLQRRLAQNREAARKSHLRKKAYVQQLESTRSQAVKQLQVSLPFSGFYPLFRFLSPPCFYSCWVYVIVLSIQRKVPPSCCFVSEH